MSRDWTADQRGAPTESPKKDRKKTGNSGTGVGGQADDGSTDRGRGHGKQQDDGRKPADGRNKAD